MNVTARVDDSIRALVLLAVAADAPLRLGRIAEAQSVSPAVLYRLLSELRCHGLVTNNRGPHGGYRLARPSHRITIGDIVRAVDGPLASVGDRHPADLRYRGSTRALRTVWVAVLGAIADVLDNITLEELSSDRLPPGIGELALDGVGERR